MKYLIPLFFLASPALAEDLSPFDVCLQEVRSSGGCAHEARKVGTPNSCCAHERNPEGQWNMCSDGVTWEVN